MNGHNMDMIDGVNLATSLSDELVGVRINILGFTVNGDFFSILRIWSHKHQAIVFDEIIENLQNFACDKNENPTLIVLYSNVLQVLDFTNLQSVKRFSVNSRNTDFDYGNVFGNYIFKVSLHTILSRSPQGFGRLMG